MLGITTMFQAWAELNAVNGQTSFATDTYKEISSKPGNIIFSPYSISVALTMTATGADKKTLDEMKKVLHLSPNFSAEYKNLSAEMKPSKDYELLIANRLWLNNAKTYYPKFTEGLKSNFNSDFLPLDFKGQPEPSRLTINKWVESATKSKIKDLIPEGAITKKTDLVITNAIYFKGLWLEPFKEENTKKDDFFVSKSAKVSTDFMNDRHTYGYFKDVDSQILEIPYKGDELSFVVVLPDENQKMDSFERSISPKRLQAWMKPKGESEIILSLPKFKAELPLDLASTLKSLGMREAFSESSANFTKIRPLVDEENISISRVVHKAFIEVNEKGTEAAAATAVMMFATTSVHPPPIVFKANRPFIYLIRHIPTNSVLFMGRLSQP